MLDDPLIANVRPEWYSRLKPDWSVLKTKAAVLLLMWHLISLRSSLMESISEGLLSLCNGVMNFETFRLTIECSALKL